MPQREEAFKGADAQDRADPRGAELNGQKTFKVVGSGEKDILRRLGPSVENIKRGMG